MSVDVAIGPFQQPFQCGICQRRFTRHENLKRHAAIHTRPEDVSLTCELCPTTFSRADLRRRHMKRRHPERENSGCVVKKTGRKGPLSTSPKQIGWSRAGETDNELATNEDLWQTILQYEQSFEPGVLDFVDGTNLSSSVPSSGTMDTVLSMSSSHSASDNRHHAAPLLNEAAPLPVGADQYSFSRDIQSLGTPASSTVLVDDIWAPSPSQKSRGVEFFVDHVSHFMPFIHLPTFTLDESDPALVLSMLCLGYQYGNDPSNADGEESGMILSRKCFDRARELVMGSNSDEVSGSPNVTTVQTLLLLQLFALMYLCGENSADGLKMHTRMISVARAGGLMQGAVCESRQTGNLESLWRHFAEAEELKRTVFAMHQIDALWYQLLSIPRSLSHLEIKHSLPCPTDSWTASSSTEWAHRELVNRTSNPLPQYGDAVRSILGSKADPSSTGIFDPYGAINIAHFLISSAREVSGWSTMTGILSKERFEPLRRLLIALGPLLYAPSNAAQLCEATWHIAMIELQMWSASHTGGIVESCIDVMLRQSTYLASSNEIHCDTNLAHAIQPHVDWFLHYLESSRAQDHEAPWVALYAYKAFLIAWQFLRGGIPGAMCSIDIQHGDIAGALTWARTVFRRRRHWQFGKLIIACLHQLETGAPL